jgi:hypothetical protein
MATIREHLEHIARTETRGLECGGYDAWILLRIYERQRVTAALQETHDRIMEAFSCLATAARRATVSVEELGRAFAEAGKALQKEEGHAGHG